MVLKWKSLDISCAHTPDRSEHLKTFYASKTRFHFIIFSNACSDLSTYQMKWALLLSSTLNFTRWFVHLHQQLQQHVSLTYHQYSSPNPQHQLYLKPQPSFERASVQFHFQLTARSLNGVEGHRFRGSSTFLLSFHGQWINKEQIWVVSDSVYVKNPGLFGRLEAMVACGIVRKCTLAKKTTTKTQLQNQHSSKKQPNRLQNNVNTTLDIHNLLTLVVISIVSSNLTLQSTLIDYCRCITITPSATVHIYQGLNRRIKTFLLWKSITRRRPPPTDPPRLHF